MLIALVTAVFRGASAIGKVLTWLLGVADLSTRYATLTFTREFIGSILGALIALLAWWYHWINVRGENEGN
jgi:ABC-type nickel/cobalt efflux system permease component RcnA